MKKEKALKIIKKLDILNMEIGSSGNISFRADKNKIFIKPSGFSFSEVNKDNLSVVNSEGILLEGAKPSSDLGSHLFIYKKRPDINCIIHSHAHFTSVFAILGIGIPVCSTMHADYFGKSIPCLPFLNHRTSNYGEQIIKAGVNMALLEKHGSLLLIQDLSNASHYARAFEEICKLYYHTLVISNIKNISLRKFSKTDIKILNDYYVNKYGQHKQK